MVFLSGPCQAGKTTLAKWLQSRLTPGFPSSFSRPVNDFSIDGAPYGTSS